MIASKLSSRTMPREVVNSPVNGLPIGRAGEAAIGSRSNRIADRLAGGGRAREFLQLAQHRRLDLGEAQGLAARDVA